MVTINEKKKKESKLFINEKNSESEKNNLEINKKK